VPSKDRSEGIFFGTPKSNQMGKLKDGFHFSGKFSNVVGATWNGISYIRAAPHWKGGYKPTAKQIANQQKFRFAMEQLKHFRRLFELTIEKQDGQSRASQAMTAMLRDAITGAHPDLAMDYSRMLVAKGSLAPALEASANSAGAGTISFQWSHDPDVKKSNERFHQAMFVAYLGENEGVYHYLHGPYRRENRWEWQIPSLAGKSVHTWMSFRSMDMRMIANSVYTGVVKVK
jgi:hypothetical protein